MIILMWRILMSRVFRSNYRVYYEDTDAGGVVYNANYLKFAERARTEVLRSLNISQDELMRKEGTMFVVRRIEIDFKKPAKLDDLISVETIMGEFKGASTVWQQNLFFEKINLCSIKVQLVIVNRNLKPIRVPELLKSSLCG